MREKGRQSNLDARKEIEVDFPLLFWKWKNSGARRLLPANNDQRSFCHFGAMTRFAGTIGASIYLVIILANGKLRVDERTEGWSLFE